uniref:Disease resistance N-terminal domain-containing protein n=2 Tax=Salix TaxID=40685 RepID=A0A6N2LK93_SALVM
MTDALVSPILELLLKIAAQQVQEEVNLVGVEKQVDKLRSNLIDIQSVLEDAERKQVKVKAVRVWLDKLKDVQEEVNLVVGVEKQVDKLKSNLIDIQSVIEDAERKQVKDKAVRVWLDKLKDGFDVVILPSRSKQLVKNWMRLPKRKEPIPVTQLVRETAAVMQEFTQSGGVRPFGVSLLVSGFDDKGLRLYQLCMALNCTKPLIMNCRDYQVTPLLMTRACVAEMMKRKVL